MLEQAPRELTCSLILNTLHPSCAATESQGLRGVRQVGHTRGYLVERFSRDDVFADQAQQAERNIVLRNSTEGDEPRGRCARLGPAPSSLTSGHHKN